MQGLKDFWRHEGDVDLLSEPISLVELGGSINGAPGIRTLRLHWVTYETLVQSVPDSELKPPFLDFASRFNGTKSDLPRDGEG